MKGKFLATTLCITGLAIIVLPTSHSDASWATQYLKTMDTEQYLNQKVLMLINL